MSDKPRGSGYFAVICSAVLLAALWSSFYVDLANIPREWLVRAWLFFAALVLLYWGGHRIADGEKGDTRVGQDTINLVIGILGATVALLELLKRGK